jgi:hypothetical protein
MRSVTKQRLRPSFAALRQSVSTSFALKVPRLKPARSIESEVKFAYVASLIEQSEAVSRLKPKRKLLLTSEERSLMLKQKSIQLETQIQVCRSTKQALLESQVLRRSMALESKFRRFEMRCQSELVLKISRSWASMLVAVGALTVHLKKGTNYKVLPRQRLKARAYKNTRFLMHVSIFLGKLLLQRRRKAIRSNAIKLQRLLKPVRHWLAVRRVVLAGRMANSIEYSLTNNMIFMMMVRWRQHIVFIQSQVRCFLTFRRHVYSLQLKRLREVEVTSVKGKRRTESQSLIPEGVKLYFLRKELRGKFLKQLEALKHYKLVWQEVTQYNAVIRAESDFTNRSSLLLLPQPIRPVLDLNYPAEVYRSILVAASSSRFFWDKILSSPDIQIELHMRHSFR